MVDIDIKKAVEGLHYLSTERELLPNVFVPRMGWVRDVEMNVSFRHWRVWPVAVHSHPITDKPLKGVVCFRPASVIMVDALFLLKKGLAEALRAKRVAEVLRLRQGAQALLEWAARNTNPGLAKVLVKGLSVKVPGTLKKFKWSDVLLYRNIRV